MDSQVAYISIIIGLYLVAAGCVLGLRDLKQGRTLQFQDLPAEVRHNIYRFVFSDLNHVFFSTAIKPRRQRVQSPENLSILLTCKFILEDATPVLVTCCRFQLGIHRGSLGRLQRLERELQAPWTNQIQHVTIDNEILTLLLNIKPVHRLANLKSVVCWCAITVKWTDTTRRYNGHDAEEEPEQYFGMVEEDIDSELSEGDSQDEDDTIRTLRPIHINNIVEARNVKFQLHELTAQMDEVFPHCEQLMVLQLNFEEGGGWYSDPVMSPICKALLTEHGLWFVQRGGCVGDWRCWEDVLSRGLAFYRDRDARLGEIEDNS